MWACLPVAIFGTSFASYMRMTHVVVQIPRLSTSDDPVHRVGVAASEEIAGILLIDLNAVQHQRLGDIATAEFTPHRCIVRIGV